MDTGSWVQDPEVKMDINRVRVCLLSAQIIGLRYGCDETSGDAGTSGE